MMILLLIVLAVILYVAIRNPNLAYIFGGRKYEDVFLLQKEIHDYSGLNNDQYMSYLVSIDNALAFVETDTVEATKNLYSGLEKLRDLAINTPAGDSDIPGELNKYADKLGKVIEGHIMKYALQNGFKFSPRYLNNKFIII